MVEAKSETMCGIFWDIENVHIPKSTTTRSFIETIRKSIIIENGLKESDFVCVCDAQKLSPNISEHLNLTGITVIHINSWSKNAADEKLKELMIKFVNTYGNRSVIVLISGDVNFVPLVRGFKRMQSTSLYLLYNQSASQDLIKCADKLYPISELVNQANEKKVVNKITDEDPSIRYLLVNGLPSKSDYKSILIQLKHLSSNCGGKVIRICNDSAWLQFGCFSDAQRALQRMNNSLIDNNRIQVSFTNCPNKNRIFKHSSKGKNETKVTRYVVVVEYITKELTDTQIRDTLMPVVSYFNGNIIEISPKCAWLQFQNFQISQNAIKALQSVSTESICVDAYLQNFDDLSPNCKVKANLNIFAPNDACYFFIETNSESMTKAEIQVILSPLKDIIAESIFINNYYASIQVDPSNRDRVHRYLTFKKLSHDFNFTVWTNQPNCKVNRMTCCDDLDDKLDSRTLQSGNCKKHVIVRGLPGYMDLNQADCTFRTFIQPFNGRVVYANNGSAWIEFPNLKNSMEGIDTLKRLYIDEFPIFPSLCKGLPKSYYHSKSPMTLHSSTLPPHHRHHQHHHHQHQHQHQHQHPHHHALVSNGHSTVVNGTPQIKCMTQQCLLWSKNKKHNDLLKDHSSLNKTPNKTNYRNNHSARTSGNKPKQDICTLM